MCVLSVAVNVVGRARAAVMAVHLSGGWSGWSSGPGQFTRHHPGLNACRRVCRLCNRPLRSEVNAATLFRAVCQHAWSDSETVGDDGKR